MTKESEEKSVAKRTKIDVQKALKLRLKGLSYDDIAEVLGCSKPGVHEALTNFRTLIKDINPGDLEAYAEERKNVLSAAEMKLLKSCLDDEAIKKAPLHSRVMAFGVMTDKRRLEEGKSTENLGILGKILIEAETELGKEKKESKTAFGSHTEESKKESVRNRTDGDTSGS